MQEKDIVLDVLAGAKASLGSYAKVITETADQNLRAMFQQMRDAGEQFQYDLYKIASQKGYYVNPPKADMTQADTVKQALCQGMTQPSVMA